MRLIKTLSVVTIVLGLVGCTSIRVKSEYSTDTNFSQLKSYAWAADSTEKIKQLNIDDPEFDQLFFSVIDDALRSKGFRKTDARQADLVVDCYAAIDVKVAVSETDTPDSQLSQVGLFHYKPAAGWSVEPTYGGDQDSREYEQGTLILSLVKSDSDETVWLSIAEAEVLHNAPNAFRKRRFRKVIRRMFIDFPSQ